MNFKKCLPTLLLVVFFPVIAEAQPIVYKYPATCTTGVDLKHPLEKNQEMVSCSWLSAGSSLLTPYFVQIKDWDSTLQLDVALLSSIIAGLATTENGLVAIGTMWGYDGAKFIPVSVAAGGYPQIDITTQTLTAVKVSATAAANTAANPMHMQTSADGTNSVDATHPFFVQQTDGTASNAVDHPTWFRLSIDGTDPMDATHPMAISKDLTLNSVTNPLALRLSIDGTNWLGASNPVPISKDDSPNATGNRFWITSNTDQVGGAAINVNGGNKDAGTPTVAIADDDNVSTKLTDIDIKVTVEDYDTGAGTINKQAVGLVFPGAGAVVKAPGDANGMDVDINSQTLTAVKVSATAAANTALNPFFVSSAGATSTTAAAGPMATDATADLILSSQDVSEHECWGIHLTNNGGGSGSALTDADVQVSRDGGTTWTSLTWTGCDTLAAAANCDYDFSSNSFTNVRVYTTAAVDTTVTVKFSARK